MKKTILLLMIIAALGGGAYFFMTKNDKTIYAITPLVGLLCRPSLPLVRLSPPL
jgi:hypothetical protein